MRTRTACIVISLLLAMPAGLAAQTPVMLGLGDSLGEGVQSADANVQTQPWSFLNILAWKFGFSFPLPLIRSGAFGAVGDTSGRSRVDPNLPSANLAVSGATVRDLLFQRADSVVDTEADLVLSPRLGLSQVEIAESLHAPFVLCWIGGNDALSAVTTYDQLDASQMTPVAEFSDLYHQAIARLVAAGSFVALANIPDVGDIATLLDNRDLRRFLGSDYGLPDGYRTTVMAMFFVRLGLQSSSIFSDPNYVLDPAELAAISARITAFNAVIASTAAEFNLPVADIHGWFRSIATAEPTIFGVKFTARYLGGLFSLDGVHPSNFGQAIVASAFIASLSAHFHIALPTLSLTEWTQVVATDPFIDRDGDGRVTGRRNAGLLETLGPLVGVSGDTESTLASASTAVQADAAVDLLASHGNTGEDVLAPNADPEAKRRSAAIAALRRLFDLRRQ